MLLGLSTLIVLLMGCSSTKSKNIDPSFTVKKINNTEEYKLILPTIADIEAYKRVGIVKLELTTSENSKYVFSKLYSKKINDWVNFKIRNNDKVILPEHCEVKDNEFLCKFDRKNFETIDMSKKFTFDVITRSGIKKQTNTPKTKFTEKYLCKASAKSYANSLSLSRTEYREVFDNYYNNCIKKEPITKIVGGTEFGSEIIKNTIYSKSLSEFINNIKNDNYRNSFEHESYEEKKEYFIKQYNEFRDEYLNLVGISYLNYTKVSIQDNSGLISKKYINDNFFYEFSRIDESTYETGEMFLKKYRKMIESNPSSKNELNFNFMSHKDIDNWLTKHVFKNKKVVLNIEHKEYGKSYLKRKENISFEFDKKLYNPQYIPNKEWSTYNEGYISIGVFYNQLKLKGKDYLKKNWSECKKNKKRKKYLTT